MAMVMILPLFHGFGLCMGMHTMLANGMRCILVPQFSPDVLAQSSSRKNRAYRCGPDPVRRDPQNHHLKNADLSCLKAVFCGGDT
jgi:long-chain acyl-CoA synthetase